MSNLPFLRQDELVVYLDGVSLKMATVRTQQGKSEIQHVFYSDVSALDENGLVDETVRGLAAVRAGSVPARVVVTSKFAITKSVEVPSFDPQEIEAIVKLQSSRHTPYSKDEIICNHLNLEEVLERYTKALLVIISLGNIRKHLDVLRLAGVEIGKVEVAFEGVAQGLVEAGLVADGDVTGAVLVDVEHADLIVMCKSKPFFVRSVGIGTKQLQQVASRRELAAEIQKSIEAFQSAEPNRSLQKLLLIGPDSSDIAQLAAEVKSACGLPLEQVRAADHVAATSQARASESEMFQSPMDAVLFPAVLRRPAAMDFIPDDLKTRRSFRGRAQQIFAAATFAMIIAALLLGVFVAKVYLKSSYIGALDKNFAAKNQQAERLIGLSDQSALIRQFEAKRGSGLRALTQLETALPREMYLNELSVDAEGKVAIKGTSELMSRVFSFVTEFENNPVFKNVKNDYAKSRKVDGKDMTDFGLSANLEEV